MEDLANILLMTLTFTIGLYCLRCQEPKVVRDAINYGLETKGIYGTVSTWFPMLMTILVVLVFMNFYLFWSKFYFGDTLDASLVATVGTIVVFGLQSMVYKDRGPDDLMIGTSIAFVYITLALRKCLKWK